MSNTELWPLTVNVPLTVEERQRLDKYFESRPGQIRRWWLRDLIVREMEGDGK